MSFILFRDTECARPAANQPTYLALGTCLDIPAGTGSIQVGTLPGCPNSGQPTLFLSSSTGCEFPTESTGSGSGSGSGSGGGSGGGSGSGSGSGSGGGSTYSGSGGTSGGHNSSSTTGGGTGEGGSGDGSGSSSESSHGGGSEHTTSSWQPSPTFIQGSEAMARAAIVAEGFAGVNMTGTCTRFQGQSIGSIQFACPEFARQPGPTATSTSGGGSLQIQSRSRAYGAIWWTLIGGWVVLGLLGGG
ncbi:hypothetical protein PG996_001411 [Apiospora saccharicola]|uniref:Uncharacterized protein n=1 Tax=Apiospora saccharicola TaxID=335842 RepID=A0ABR1WGK3_9PEZI